MIDSDQSVIVDIEVTRSVRHAEESAAQTMIDRTQDRYHITADWLVADIACGSAEILAWLTKKRGIIPFIPRIDKSGRRHYRTTKAICDACPSTLRRCPNTNTCFIGREELETVRDVARRVAGSRFKAAMSSSVWLKVGDQMVRGPKNSEHPLLAMALKSPYFHASPSNKDFLKQQSVHWCKRTEATLCPSCCHLAHF